LWLEATGVKKMSDLTQTPLNGKQKKTESQKKGNEAAYKEEEIKIISMSVERTEKKYATDDKNKIVNQFKEKKKRVSQFRELFRP
jgi:hypothetical protein